MSPELPYGLLFLGVFSDTEDLYFLKYKENPDNTVNVQTLGYMRLNLESHKTERIPFVQEILRSNFKRRGIPKLHVEDQILYFVYHDIIYIYDRNSLKMKAEISMKKRMWHQANFAGPALLIDDHLLAVMTERNMSLGVHSKLWYQPISFRFDGGKSYGSFSPELLIVDTRTGDWVFRKKLKRGAIPKNLVIKREGGLVTFYALTERSINVFSVDLKELRHQ